MKDMPQLTILMKWTLRNTIQVTEEMKREILGRIHLGLRKKNVIPLTLRGKKNGVRRSEIFSLSSFLIQVNILQIQTHK